MKAKKDWEVTEQIVTVLEKFISPNSVVEHNVKKPVLGSDGRRKRQCDIIITITNGPKQTMILVEVQKRSRKPDIDKFNGWVEKMREIGAQQLICVSEAGFPDSVIDKVKNSIGIGTVTLMTLKEFDNINNPQRVNVEFLFTEDNGKFEFHKIGQAQLDADKYEIISINTDDNVFIAEHIGKRMNLKELMAATLREEKIFKKFENLPEGQILYPIEINPESRVFVLYNEKTLLILKWEFILSLELKSKPIVTSTKQYVYSQEIINGALAWIAATQFKVKNKLIEVRVIFKTDNGKVTLGFDEKVISE